MNTFCHFLLCCFMVTMAVNGKAQNSWIFEGNNAGGSKIEDVFKDESGNIYGVGRFEGGLSMGNTNFVSNGGMDVVLVKLDSSGNLTWQRHFGGSGFDMGTGIFVNNDIYIAGQFSNTVSIQGETIQSQGGIDIFIAKFNSNGNLQWLKRGGSAYDDNVTSIYANKSRVYITGSFIGGNADFGNANLSSNGLKDVFVSKLNANSGDFIRSRATGGNQNESGKKIIVSETTSDVFVLGEYQSSGQPIFGQNVTNEGDDDIFVAHLDSQFMDLHWLNTATGPNNDLCRTMTLDKEGNLLISGFFDGDLTINNTTLQSQGNSDVFIAKYKSNGNTLWAKSYGGSNREVSRTIKVRDNAIYLGGFYNGSFTAGAFDFINAYNDFNPFIMKLNDKGEIIAGYFSKGNGWDQLRKMALGDDNRPVIAGYYNNSFEISSNSSISTTNNKNELMIAQLDNCLGFNSELNATSPLGFCKGDSVTLKAPKFSNYNYKWFDSMHSLTNTNHSLTIDYEGDIRVSMENNFGCQFQSSTIQTVEHDLPDPGISIKGDSVFIDLGQSFEWFHDGESLGSKTNARIKAEKSGKYYAFVTDSNGCSAYTDTVNVQISGVSGFKSTKIEIYPNPVNDHIFINQGGTKNPSSYKLINSAGKVFQKGRLEDNKAKISVRDLPKGVYFIRVKTNKKMSTGRFVKK